MHISILARRYLKEGIQSETLNKEANAIVIVEPDMSLEDKENLFLLIKNYFKNYIMVSFWDLEKDFDSYKIISEEISIFLAEFIKEAKGDFIVSCAAGMSRSAGVGKAIGIIKDYNGDIYLSSLNPNSWSNKIQYDNRYSPNKTVETMIIDAYMKISKKNDDSLTQINEENLLSLENIFSSYDYTIDKEIKISKNLYTVFLKALDLYISLHLGRIDELLRIDSPMKELFSEEKLLEIRDMYLNNKEKCFETLSLGISNKRTPLKAKIAYDILQVFRYKKAWLDNPNGGVYLSFDKPMYYSHKVFLDFTLKQGYIDYILENIILLNKNLNFFENLFEFLLNINEKEDEFLYSYFEQLKFQIDSNIN